MDLSVLSMGEYGPDVWSCYAVTAAALFGLVVATRAGLERELAKARRRIRSVPHTEEFPAATPKPGAKLKNELSSVQ